ncbi:carboxylate--amine ligase, partial [Streptomyces sp. NPDC008238]
DARLSHTYPTVEFRVADVCLDASSTALLATLVRALVETAARAWRAGQPPSGPGVALLRLATWQAAREGLGGRLLHPVTWEPAPAEAVVRALFDHVRDALEDNGDLIPAQEALAALLKTGNGAQIQRELLRRTGSLREVTAACARRTRA